MNPFIEVQEQVKLIFGVRNQDNGYLQGEWRG